MKQKLRKGDEVIVITGNDRGQTGKILSCDGRRVVVEGVNVRKKHMRPTQQNQKGQIIDIECPIQTSNVKPYVGGKAARLRIRTNKEGEREFYILDGGKQVLYRPVKKEKA